MIARVVIVGKGSIGQKHHGIFLELLGDQHVTLVSAGIRDGLSEEHVVQSVLDEQPTHVVIATPAHLHLSLAIKLKECIPALKLLIEKPLVADAHRCLGLQQMQWLKTYESDIQVGYNLHFTEMYQFLVESLSSIGKLVWSEFRVGQSLNQWRLGRDLESTVSLNKSFGGGVLNELSHEIDMVVSLFDVVKFSNASTQTGYFQDQVEEAAQVSLSASNNGTISIALDFYRPVAQRQVIVAGTDAMLSIDFIAGKGWLDKNGDISEFDFSLIDSYVKQAEYFLSEQQGSRLAPTVSSAIKTCQLISTIKEYTKR